MRNALLVLIVICSLLLITVILLQPSKQDGLKGFIGGTQDTFFSRNKGRTKETFLVRMTVILAALIAILSLALQFVK